MTKISSIINSIYVIIISLGCAVLPILRYEKNDNSRHELAENKVKWVIAPKVVAYVLFFAIFLFCIIRFSIFGATFGMLYIVLRVIMAFESIKNIVSDIKSSKKSKYLTNGTCEAITIVVIAFLMINPMGLIIKIIDWKKESSCNLLVEFICMSGVIIILSFVIFFLMVTMVLVTKSVIKKNSEKNKKTNVDNVETYYNTVISWIDYHIHRKQFTQKWIEIKKKWDIIGVIFFLCDVVINILSYSLVLVLVFIFLIPTVLIRYIKLLFLKFYSWFDKLSERRLIRYSFRCSFIIAMVIFEIIARCERYTFSINSGMELYEFIASAIIIPLIISWISEIRLKQ